MQAISAPTRMAANTIPVAAATITTAAIIACRRTHDDDGGQGDADDGQADLHDGQWRNGQLRAKLQQHGLANNQHHDRDDRGLYRRQFHDDQYLSRHDHRRLASCSTKNGRTTCTWTRTIVTTATATTVTKTGAAPYTHTWVINDHSTWTGCIEDRNQDYDISNTTPTSTTTNFPAENTDYCPPSSMVPLTDDWTSLKSAVDEMTAAGSTDQPVGLALGLASADRGRAVQPRFAAGLHLASHHHPRARRVEHAGPLVWRRFEPEYAGRCAHDGAVHKRQGGGIRLCGVRGPQRHDRQLDRAAELRHRQRSTISI